MTQHRNTWLKCATLIFSVTALAACGGGSGDNSDPDSGGGYGGTPSSSPQPTATPTITPTITPNPTATPGPEPTATPAPVTVVSTSSTNIGDTFIVEGSVTVLVPDASGEGFERSAGDFDGRTLYVFDQDPVGASACTSNGCVSNWPPLLASDSDEANTPLSIITRDDGERQWALRDKPLYFFAGDSVVGDINGEGIGGVWHVAVSQPTSLSDSDISADQGDYFVAYGEVIVGTPETAGDNTRFVSAAEDKTGFALYTFDNDTSGQSNCTNGCLVNWPPLLADEGDLAAAPYSLITRQMNDNGDTALQWALNGKALYFFAGDAAVGETNGKSLANWRLARPEPWKAGDTTLGTALLGAGLAKVAAPNNSSEEETSDIAKDGFSLYTFDNDTEGASNCIDNCLSTWPALMANEGAVAAAPYSLITRATGELQWALEGKPLYFFSGDTSIGDVNGDGVGGVWHLARPVPLVIDTFGDVKAFKAHGDLVDANGDSAEEFEDFTVYIFTEDDNGASTCFGGCASTWPPLFAAEDAREFGDFTIIVRDDPSTTDDDNANIRQWSYKNQPLYFFVGDSAPGQTNGVYGTWFLAEP